MATVNIQNVTMREIVETTLRARSSRGTWYLSGAFKPMADKIASEVLVTMPYRCFGDDLEAVIGQIKFKISAFETLCSQPTRRLLEHHPCQP